MKILGTFYLEKMIIRVLGAKYYSELRTDIEGQHWLTIDDEWPVRISKELYRGLLDAKLPIDRITIMTK